MKISTASSGAKLTVKKTIAHEKAKSAFSGSLTLDSRGASINPGQLTLDSRGASINPGQLTLDSRGASINPGQLTLDSRGASINPGQFLFSQQAGQSACAFVLWINLIR
jgi:hypothetical protein